MSIKHRHRPASRGTLHLVSPPPRVTPSLPAKPAQPKTKAKTPAQSKPKSTPPSPERVARVAANRAAEKAEQRAAAERRLARREALRAHLALSFPVFDPDDPAPLALGIRDELRAARPDLTRKVTADFLAWWSLRQRYLLAIRHRPRRHHLDGREVDGAGGEITDDQRQHAKRRLQAWKREKTARKLARRADAAAPPAPSAGV